MRLHNHESLKFRRRQLRQNLTPAEARLWSALQHSQLAGRKFRRQHSIGNHIVDFYCPSERLIIELDGAPHDHETAWRRDQEREAFLRAHKLDILRFENHAVMENLEGVLTLIQQHFITK